MSSFRHVRMAGVPKAAGGAGPKMDFKEMKSEPKIPAVDFKELKVSKRIAFRINN